MPAGVYPRPTLAQRFWLSVGPLTATNCVEWQRSADRKGYGKMWVASASRRATHVRWFLCHGEWPQGQMMHSCDNPSCVNIDHLRVGTAADNIADKTAKGRQARGERNGNSKLTEDKVRAICASDEANKIIAAKLGVHPSLVWLVRKRKIRAHVSIHNL